MNDDETIELKCTHKDQLLFYYRLQIQKEKRYFLNKTEPEKTV